MPIDMQAIRVAVLGHLQICSIDYHVAVNAVDANGVVRCAYGKDLPA